MYIDHAIYKNRPGEKRSDIEDASYDILERLGIEFERMDHDAANTMAECDEIDRLMDMKACKNLFLCNKQKNKFFLVVISGDKRFDTKVLSAQLNLPRLSFASGEQMDELLGIRPGSVSILAIANDLEGKVRLLVDRDVLKDEFFGCHPCKNTSSLKIKTSDIFEKFIPCTNHTPAFFDC